MKIQVKPTDDVTYENGEIIAVNGVKVAKGNKAKSGVRDRIMKEIKNSLLESAFYSSDINMEPFFLRSPSNDYVIEVTGKKDESAKGSVVITSGGAVSEYAAGVLRIAVIAMRSIPDCEVLWAEGSKVRLHFAAGDYEVRVVKKRDRICG